MKKIMIAALLISGIPWAVEPANAFSDELLLNGSLTLLPETPGETSISATNNGPPFLAPRGFFPGVELVEPGTKLISDFVYLDPNDPTGQTVTLLSDGDTGISIGGVPVGVSLITAMVETGQFQDVSIFLSAQPGQIQVLSDVEATPLPPTWTMLLAGLAAFGFFYHRGAKRNYLGIATA
jgi:hypothetical protein